MRTIRVVLFQDEIRAVLSVLARFIHEKAHRARDRAWKMNRLPCGRSLQRGTYTSMLDTHDVCLFFRNACSARLPETGSLFKIALSVLLSHWKGSTRRVPFFSALKYTSIFSFKYRKCGTLQLGSTSFMLLLIENEVKLQSVLFALKRQPLAKINRALIAFLLLATFIFGSGGDGRTIEPRLKLIIVGGIGCLLVKRESDS